jgi:hypothetical protein
MPVFPLKHWSSFTIKQFIEPSTLHIHIRLTVFLSMPHLPSEEETESNIFDKVAKGNPESTASDRPLHRENEEPVKASVLRVCRASVAICWLVTGSATQGSNEFSCIEGS